MELSEFISSTILGIAEGIKKAQEKEAELDFRVNPNNFTTLNDRSELVHGFSRLRIGDERNVQFIEFELVVEAQSTNGKEGGASINVANVLQIGGAKNKEKVDKLANTIKFSIPMVFPVGKGD